MRRIAIAGLMHESNTFVSEPTGRRQFEARAGADLALFWRDSHHEVGGFLQAAMEADFEPIPLIMATATPGGPVTDDVLNWWMEEFVDRWKAALPCDGLLLALHGAMVIESHPDGDAEVAQRVRAVIGHETPMVVTHDFHANLCDRVVAAATALIVYRTNPHVDQRERGTHAARLLTRIIREGLRPTVALAKPPMLWNILHQNTSREPLRSIMEEVARLERDDPAVLAASVAIGYPYADVEEVGPSVVIVTQDDTVRARSEAVRIADQLWSCREQLRIDLPDAAEAVRRTIARERAPVILVEMGDNIGGGSPGDGTWILHELLKQNTSGWCVVLADPEGVQRCVRAGIDSQMALSVGGKTDSRHGPQVEIVGRVRSLHDGRFTETEPRHGGRRHNDQGITAVIEVEALSKGGAAPSYVVLTTHRQPPFSLHQLISLGIQPERQRILVVKAAIAYRAAYEPIAGAIIEVDTPGVTAVNPARFTYRNARRPIWPLD